MIPRFLPLVAVAMVASACSGSSAPRSEPSPATTGSIGTGTVHAIDALPGRRFSVTSLSLKVGDSVLVTDRDSGVPHNFVVAGVGRSGTMSEGQTFTLTFRKAGSYRFVCTFHQSSGMEGTLTVS